MSDIKRQDPMCWAGSVSDPGCKALQLQQRIAELEAEKGAVPMTNGYCTHDNPPCAECLNAGVGVMREVALETALKSQIDICNDLRRHNTGLEQQLAAARESAETHRKLFDDYKATSKELETNLQRQLYAARTAVEKVKVAALDFIQDAEDYRVNSIERVEGVFHECRMIESRNRLRETLALLKENK